MNNFHNDTPFSRVRLQPVKLVKGCSYMVNGEHMTFVRIFNIRGIVKRFAYQNGHVVDFNPGEITTLSAIKTS